MNAQSENKVCPYCNSRKTRKFGFRPRVKGKIQQYLCNDCGKVFTDENIVEIAVTN